MCPVLLWLQEEVETVVSMLIEQARALARTGMKKHLRVLPMYAGLPSPEQLKVFERVPHSVRKVRLLCLSQIPPPRRASAALRLHLSALHLSALHRGTIANPDLREVFCISHQCLSACKLGTKNLFPGFPFHL